jgi:hypothetical protein
MELCTFLELDDIPESYKKYIKKSALDNWQVDFEAALKHLPIDIKAELDCLYSMLKVDKVNEAVFRAPRLLALCWVNGMDITVPDNRLLFIMTKHLPLKKAKKELSSILGIIKKKIKDLK